MHGLSYGGRSVRGFGLGLTETLEYKAAWEKLKGRIEAEGLDVGLAKDQFDGAIHALTPYMGLDPGVYAKAGQAVTAAYTIAGAVGSVETLESAIAHGATPAQIIQAIGGVLSTATTLAVAAGVALSPPGIGTAIAGGIVLASFAASLIWPTPTDLKNVCGADVNQAWNCVSRCLLAVDICKGYQIKSSENPNWQTFPVKSDWNDMVWYYPIYTNQANVGNVHTYTQWDSPSFNWGKQGIHWAVPRNGDVPAETAFGPSIFSIVGRQNTRQGWRNGFPYDEPFGRFLGIDPFSDDGVGVLENYRDAKSGTYPEWYGDLDSSLSDESIAQAFAFMRVYSAAWKANFEFVFNGLRPLVPIEDEYKILMQVVRTWNRAHDGATVYSINAGTVGYLPNLIRQIASDSYSEFPGKITINIGPRKIPPSVSISQRYQGEGGAINTPVGGIELTKPVSGSTTQTGMSTGAKVAIGVGVVGASAAAYSYFTHGIVRRLIRGG